MTDEKKPESGARVFISYSRRDSEIAGSLRDRLAAAGFDAFLDVHDIAPAEPWRERISALIAQAEKVVLLISPHFIASEICGWEIDEAERRGKTLIPVEIGTVDHAEVPGRLSRLNFLAMRSPEERETAFPNLVDTLTTDLAWERERSRLDEMAAEWEASGRARRRLILSEDALRAAESWRDARPQSANPPTTRQIDFLRESRRARSARQRMIMAGLLVVVAITTGTAMVALEKSRDEARARLDAVQFAQRTEQQLMYMLQNCPAGLPSELMNPDG